jgi:hypothetical protein
MSAHWIPAELAQFGARRMVRWIRIDGSAVWEAPFFSQAIDALTAAHAVEKLTPIESLLQAAPAAAPRGFIFHVSRCGSTLASRSLAALPGVRVIAEPTPVNQLLLAEGLDPGDRAALLQGLIGALCDAEPGTASIIKFTSWNLLFIEQILALYPATPWVFLYREPEAILRSLVDAPPRWAADETLTRRLPPGAGAVPVRVLDAMFAAASARMDRHAMLVDYAELPDALPGIAAHFGLAPAAADGAAMAQAARYDAKQPGAVPFVPHERPALPAGLAHEAAGLARRYRECERMRSVQHADALRRAGDLAAAAAAYAALPADGAVTSSVAILAAALNGADFPGHLPKDTFAPAPFVLLDDYLDEGTHQGLLAHALSDARTYIPTELERTPGGDSFRTGLVTFDLGPFGELIRARVQAQLPRLCARLGLVPFEAAHIQLKIAAYGSGDHFKAHQDNGERHPDRKISFVYYFHREPKPYEGGDLLLYDSRFAPRAFLRTRYTRIIPRNNQVVFFPSEYFHEVEPIISGGADFRGSRFTIAGHIS